MRKSFNRLIAGAISIVVTATVLLIACKKNHIRSGESKKDITSQFFAVNQHTDPLVVSIVQSIQRQDRKRNFINRLVQKAGFARWDKAKVEFKEDKQMIFVPFVQEGKKQTRGILLVKLSGTDTLYHMLYNTQYGQYGFGKEGSEEWKAKDIFSAFILFDKELFGHTEFILSDKRIFNGTDDHPRKVKIADVRTNQEARGSVVLPVTVWVTVIVCGTCQAKNGTGTDSQPFCCNASYYDMSITYWFDDENDEWGWYPPQGGGGGGGGSVAPCPGCNWEDTNPCEVDQYGHILSFCDEYWEPVITQPGFNPLNYDSIGIDDALELVYPCVADMIEDSLPNSNYLAQLAGASVFKDSAFMHLTFDTSTTLTQMIHPTAETETTVAPFLNDDGVTVFSAAVHLNGWYLRNATYEYLVSTILHESMHAIFTMRWGQYLRWKQYGQGTIDSNWIKIHYPSQWYYLTGQNVRLSALQQHEMMAADYMSLYKTIMNQQWNPSANAAVRDSVLNAMGYCGLTETTVWKALPAKGVDTCKYRAIQVCAEKSLNGITYNTNENGVGICRNYGLRYSDSLQLRPNNCH